MSMILAESASVTEARCRPTRNTRPPATSATPDANRIPSVVASTIRCVSTQNRAVMSNVIGAIRTRACAHDRPHHRSGPLKIDPTTNPVTIPATTSLGK